MNAPNNHILIVGTGFAGLAMAIRLKKAGIQNFTLLEQASELGGTWRDNTYPAAACDIPSHVYSFSFEPNPNWSRQFSGQAEIFAYMQHCAKKYGIYPHIRFKSTVLSANFEEESALWTLAIKDGQPLQARFFILCTGGLSRPAYPAIAGLNSFKGKLFHSARWAHDFPLENSRVALIGTGASSIQIVPAIAAKLKQLYLFQRTPAWILPKPDKVFSRWQRFLLAKLPLYQWLLRGLIYWQFEIRAIALLKPRLMHIAQRRAFKFLNKQVSDPELKEKLTPKYTMGCKRILLSNDFYESLRLPQVKLLTEEIESITPHGIRTKDGQEFEVDAIICATGFAVAEASAPFTIKGRASQDLSQSWRQGAEAYLGTVVAGFPNMFIIVGPNTGLGHNSIVFIIEAQAQYILQAIKSVLLRRAKSLEVKPQVQKAYNEELVRRFAPTVWQTGQCQSWYLAPNGKNTTLWPGFSYDFARRTKKFDQNAFY